MSILLCVAKALHYKETEFYSKPSDCIESLIVIYNQLDSPDAAVGILKYAQHNLEADVGIKSINALHEKLGRWEHALDLYETKLEDKPEVRTCF